MTSYLAYSYSTNLSKNEAIVIDKEVLKDQERIWIFGENLTSNAKDKTKRLIVVGCLGVGLWFSNVQKSEAIGLSTPSRPIVRVEPSHEHQFQLRTNTELKTTPMVLKRNNCIAYISHRKILLIYVTDSRISSNQKRLKITKKLAGSETIFYMRSGGKARLFFIYSNEEKNVVEIIGESDKDSEPEVIANLKKNYK